MSHRCHPKASNPAVCVVCGSPIGQTHEEPEQTVDPSPVTEGEAPENTEVVEQGEEDIE